MHDYNEESIMVGVVVLSLLVIVGFFIFSPIGKAYSATLTQPEVNTDCYDDDLMNPFRKGTVYHSKFVFTDECVNTFTLIEYYCADEGASMERITCECVNGRCS